MRKREPGIDEDGPCPDAPGSTRRARETGRVSEVTRACPRPPGPAAAVRRWFAAALIPSPIVVLIALAVPGCIPVYHEVSVEEVVITDDAPDWEGEVPVRAYLVDGSVAVLPRGAAVRAGRLEGAGSRHSLSFDSSRAFDGISLDSVVAVEAFRGVVDTSASALGAARVVAGALGMAAVLGFAVFGSCPTVYALEPGGAADEAPLVMEAFSYSIAPLFESRDVAAIPVAPDPDGHIWLEIRNEALETHYVRHMELLEVPLEAGERVLPDPTGRPLALGNSLAPRSAVDRDGRQIADLVGASNGRPFRSSPSRLAVATIDDFEDHLVLDFEVPVGVSEAALELELRNTLLNTVLFYDVILAASGASALDWIGRDLDQIGNAVAMGRWYADRMGMRVHVNTAVGWVEAAQLSDSGPIAWKEVAVPIPVHGPGVQVRLSFPTDSWFIERVVLATTVRTPPVRVHALATAERRDGVPDPAIVRRLSVSDTLHHVTFPGEAYRVAFQVGDTGGIGAPGKDAGGTPDTSGPGAPAGRGFLLAMQGYYVEWIRGSWLRAGGGRGPFEPGDSAILEAMARWSEVMEAFENDFHESRIRR
jgi:hypothetical protein